MAKHHDDAIEEIKDTGHAHGKAKGGGHRVGLAALMAELPVIVAFLAGGEIMRLVDGHNDFSFITELAKGKFS
jgi:hypothetical protein